MTMPKSATEIMKSLNETVPQLAKFFFENYGEYPVPGDPVIMFANEQTKPEGVIFSPEEFLELTKELEFHRAFEIAHVETSYDKLYVIIRPSVTYTKRKFLNDFLGWKHDYDSN